MVHINSNVHVITDEQFAEVRPIAKIRDNCKHVMTIDVRSKQCDWTEYENTAVETLHNCYVHNIQFENAQGFLTDLSLTDNCRVLTKIRGLISVSELNALDVVVDESGYLAKVVRNGKEHRNKFTAVAFIMDKNNYGKCVFVNSIPVMFE